MEAVEMLVGKPYVGDVIEVDGSMQGRGQQIPTIIEDPPGERGVNQEVGFLHRNYERSVVYPGDVDTATRGRHVRSLLRPSPSVVLTARPLGTGVSVDIGETEFCRPSGIIVYVATGQHQT
jgi:hypothetical protein